MPPVHPPYLHIFESDGKRFAYYRRDGIRIRLAEANVRAEAFPGAYEDARRKWEAKRNAKPAEAAIKAGTLAALIAGYRAAPEFRKLAVKTKADYGRVLTLLETRFGDLPAAAANRAWVIRLRDECQDTPRTANYRVAIIGALMAYAIERGLRADNPAFKIKKLETGAGHRIWTAAEIAAMTGPAAGDVELPVMLALHTAQRQADVLRLLWSAYDGRVIRLRQGKTGAVLVIPVSAALKARLDRETRTGAVICLTAAGSAWGSDYFRHRFAEVRAKLKLPADLHFHGLRHTAATRLAESGATDREIMAMTGHKTSSMVTRYTQGAQQERLASAAVIRLGKHAKNKRSG